MKRSLIWNQIDQHFSKLNNQEINELSRAQGTPDSTTEGSTRRINKIQNNRFPNSEATTPSKKPGINNNNITIKNLINKNTTNNKDIKAELVKSKHVRINYGKSKSSLMNVKNMNDNKLQ